MVTWLVLSVCVCRELPVTTDGFREVKTLQPKTFAAVFFCVISRRNNCGYGGMHTDRFSLLLQTIFFRWLWRRCLWLSVTGCPVFFNHRIHDGQGKLLQTLFSLSTPLISLIAGILILAVPRLLNYIVAIFLIIIGLIGLFGGSDFHMR